MGQQFAVILNRNLSVGAAEHGRLRRESSERKTSLVKRAFSMRRSSSVAEGYSRIHDQYDQELLNIHEAPGLKKKRGKFLKVCKRLFGF
ncbi:hypothetical protein AMTR_s00071p00183900 [Amborella trichopoda]|uniref:Uncharacterized protein n=2 Tax=Amborella trichopoda TaxID=13333 RepID=U5D391_AMBTC|nr:hypothetical protein AMTR_s00071p00183900 [Amborella trichopoda]